MKSSSGGQAGFGRAVADQEAHQVGVAGGAGYRRGRVAVLEWRGDVHSVLGQQPHPVGHAVCDGPGQLAAQHAGRDAEGLAQPGRPGTAGVLAQPELEEQLQVVVTRLEHPVVQRLGVVGIRARGEQQPGQRLRARMPRLPHRAQLALAEHPGQHGERGGQALPQITGVGVSPGGQQQPGRAQHGVLGDRRIVPRIGQVVQRLGPVRAAFPAGRAGVAGQDAGQRGTVGRGGGRVRAPAGQLRVRGQHLTRGRPARGLIVLVPQAGQPEERVGQVRAALGRTRRHPIRPVRAGGREPGVPLDHRAMLLEPGPAGEAVPAGHHELRRA